MQIIADLQLHSRFARAVSKEMTLPNIAMWARRKGIGLVATGDWTHPLWMKEIERDLEEVGNGLLTLKGTAEPSPAFMLATEVSCIYTHAGKGRRVHTLIWVPSLASAQKINREMTRQGCNLLSDGRPIIGLSSVQVAELVFTIEPKALIIPAHAWTPWFSMYGSMSGFDSLKEAFGTFADNIYAIETGLSSNPSMNWQIIELDNRSIVSFSDAHSGPKLGREATVFSLAKGQKLSYEAIYDAIAAPFLRLREPKAHIAYTIEFHPEEGKYHYSGHRNCHIRLTPEETRKKGATCSVCGKPLTQGVMQRVEDLAGRSEESLKLEQVHMPLFEGEEPLMSMTKSAAFPKRPPFLMMVPLLEILSEAIGSPVASPKVQGPYMKLIEAFGNEFTVLLRSSIEDITAQAGERVGAAVEKVRLGDIVIDPGYDGVFGVVKIWRDGEEKPLLDPSRTQLTIFE